MNSLLIPDCTKERMLRYLSHSMSLFFFFFLWYLFFFFFFCIVSSSSWEIREVSRCNALILNRVVRFARPLEISCHVLCIVMEIPVVDWMGLRLFELFFLWTWQYSPLIFLDPVWVMVEDRFWWLLFFYSFFFPVSFHSSFERFPSSQYYLFIYLFIFVCLFVCLLLLLPLFRFAPPQCIHGVGEYVSLGHFEQDDLEVVVQYLRSLDSVSTIGLWGRSMGAVTSILHASRDPSIAGMVLDSPFSDLYELMVDIVKSRKVCLLELLVTKKGILFKFLSFPSDNFFFASSFPRSVVIHLPPSTSFSPSFLSSVTKMYVNS